MQGGDKGGNLMNSEMIAKIITSKLSNYELCHLVEYWANGKINKVFEDFLVPRDAVNYPELYNSVATYKRR